MKILFIFVPSQNPLLINEHQLSLLDVFSSLIRQTTSDPLDCRRGSCQVCRARFAPLKHCWPTMRGRKQTSSLIPVLGGPLLDPYVDPVKDCKISLRFSSFSLRSTCWVFFAIADGPGCGTKAVHDQAGISHQRPHLETKFADMLSLSSFFIQSDGSSPNWTDGAAQKRALLLQAAGAQAELSNGTLLQSTCKFCVFAFWM